MISDIFSTFDPSCSKSFIPSTTLFLFINVILILNILISLHPHPNRASRSQINFLNIIISQLIRTSSKSLKGFSIIISSLFLIIIIINLIGIIPYTFSLSSHLIFTLSLGLPIWLRLILSRWQHAPKKSIAHLLPDGAPDWLNPFLILIEITRILVRPITLSFRLAANMTAGHIVLSLVGVYRRTRIFYTSLTTIFLIIINMGYILFEFGICLIQRYIFTLLISLYRDDHAH